MLKKRKERKEKKNAHSWLTRSDFHVKRHQSTAKTVGHDHL